MVVSVWTSPDFLFKDLAWTVGDGDVTDGIWYCSCLSGVCGSWLVMCSWVYELWGPHWSIDNYKLFNYFSDFAGNWRKCVHMCQEDTCEIISQPDHSFNSYDQKSKCSIYVYHWMRLSRFRMKVLAPSDMESSYAIHWTWVLSLYLHRGKQWVYNRSLERDQIIISC